MKSHIMTGSMIAVLVAFSVHADVVSPCLTMEQSQAKYNQDMANKIAVVNTSTQQTQCYYQQLATYWQQRDKDNQQKAKDLQQIAKDKQQMDKDAQQMAYDKVLAERAANLNSVTPGTGYDEVLVFIEAITPYVGTCSPTLMNELKIIHTNRSGQADGTNPGGQTHNIRGFDNPSYTIVK